MDDMPLYRKIAYKITDLIDTGVFLPGCRIPSERELAVQFNVSRVVIREAQIVLQERGLLEVKIGSGTFVLDKYKINLYGLKKFELLELTEARALIAVAATTFAAPIITREAIAELRDLTEVISGEEKGLTCVQAHAAFHNKIACATKNNVITLVVESLWKMRTEVSQLKDLFEHNGHHIKEDYASVIEAFENKDANRAGDAMRSHFKGVLKTLVLSSEEEAYEEVKKKMFKIRSRFLITAQMS